jgi:hypothetical protein
MLTLYIYMTSCTNILNWLAITWKLIFKNSVFYLKHRTFRYLWHKGFLETSFEWHDIYSYTKLTCNNMESDYQTRVKIFIWNIILSDIYDKRLFLETFLNFKNHLSLVHHLAVEPTPYLNFLLFWVAINETKNNWAKSKIYLNLVFFLDFLTYS